MRGERSLEKMTKGGIHIRSLRQGPQSASHHAMMPEGNSAHSLTLAVGIGHPTAAISSSICLCASSSLSFMLLGLEEAGASCSASYTHKGRQITIDEEQAHRTW